MWVASGLFCGSVGRRVMQWPTFNPDWSRVARPLSVFTGRYRFLYKRPYETKPWLKDLIVTALSTEVSDFTRTRASRGCEIFLNMLHYADDLWVLMMKKCTEYRAEYNKGTYILRWFNYLLPWWGSLNWFSPSFMLYRRIIGKGFTSFLSEFQQTHPITAIPERCLKCLWLGTW